MAGTATQQGVVVVIGQVLKDSGFEMTRLEIIIEVSRRMGWSSSQHDNCISSVLNRASLNHDCPWDHIDRGVYKGRCNGHQDTLLVFAGKDLETAKEKTRHWVTVAGTSKPWVSQHRGWYFLWLSAEPIEGMITGEEFINQQEQP